MDAKQETLRFINGAKEEKDVENIGHDNDYKEQTKVQFFPSCFMASVVRNVLSILRLY